MTKARWYVKDLSTRRRTRRHLTTHCSQAVAVLRHLACLRSVWTSILMAHMGTFLGDEHAPECMSEWSVRWGAARKDVTKEALLRHLETPWGCGSCDHRLSSGVAKLGEIIEQLEGKLDF